MDKIFVKIGRDIMTVKTDRIVFIEKNLRKIAIHTLDGIIEYYGCFESIMHYLDQRFMRCHRSFIVNMDMIEVMLQNKIIFCNKETILLGRDCYLRAKKEVMEYMG